MPSKPEAHPASGRLLKVVDACREAAEHARRAAEKFGMQQYHEAAHHTLLAQGYMKQADAHMTEAVNTHIPHASAIKP